MAHYKKLIGNKCYLSPMQENDAEHLVRWYNDIDISMPECNVYNVFSKKNIEDAIKDNISRMETVFSVIDIENDKLIGMVEVSPNHVFRSGTFGIVIGEKEYWGKGYGKEATLLLLDFAFNMLNLHNIMLGVYEFNNRAYNLYKKVGFKEIGRKREYQTVAGKKYDMIMMDLLSTEYESVYVKAAMNRIDSRQ